LVQTDSGLKSIETFVGGEMVWARNDQTLEYGYRPVVATKATPDQELYEIVVINNEQHKETYYTTAEHPFWIKDHGWRKASLLEAGMTLLDRNNNDLHVVSQKLTSELDTVFNIQVQDAETYHIGELGVWVHNANCCDFTNSNAVNQSEIDILKNNGVKFTEENVVATTKTPDGQVVFLETGNSSAGLVHIIKEHVDDFANIGVSASEIPKVIMKTLSEGKIVGYQGRGTGRPIYQVEIDGKLQNIAITVGDNGFVVGANPRGGL
jgi:hypothetical protein